MPRLHVQKRTSTGTGACQHKHAARVSVCGRICLELQPAARLVAAINMECALQQLCHFAAVAAAPQGWLSRPPLVRPANVGPMLSTPRTSSCADSLRELTGQHLSLAQPVKVLHEVPQPATKQMPMCAGDCMFQVPLQQQHSDSGATSPHAATSQHTAGSGPDRIPAQKDRVHVAHLLCCRQQSQWAFVCCRAASPVVSYLILFLNTSFFSLVMAASYEATLA